MWNRFWDSSKCSILSIPSIYKLWKMHSFFICRHSCPICILQCNIYWDLCKFKFCFIYFYFHNNYPPYYWNAIWSHDSETAGSDDEFENGNERSCSCVIMWSILLEDIFVGSIFPWKWCNTQIATNRGLLRSPRINWFLGKGKKQVIESTGDCKPYQGAPCLAWPASCWIDHLCLYLIDEDFNFVTMVF